MFGKLKEKLKSSLSIFSKKTEEEAEEKEEYIEVEAPAQEEAKKEVKVEDKNEEVVEKEGEKKPEVEKVSIEKPKEEPKEDKVQETKEPRTVNPKKEELVKDIDEILEEKKEVIETVIDTKKEEVSKPVIEKKPVIEEKKESKIQETKKEIVEEKPEQLKVETKKEKKGFFKKVTQAFTTKTISAEKFEDLFWDLELVLLESNVSVKVIEKIKEDLKVELVDKPLPRNVPAKIQEVLQSTLREILETEQFDLVEKIKSKKENGEPFIITFFGINGVGKTTSIAKLTYKLQEQGLSVVLAAADTFRAAAIQQLEDHANNLNVKIIKHDYGSDAAAVSFDAVKYAKKNNIDVVMIDTAGRLHSNTNLMQELDKICRVTNPDMKIFVGESITGNDCIEQAEKFNELVDMDAAILTKADVDEHGGAPLSIAYTIKKPILYLGMGQEYKDLEKFDPELILRRLGFD